MQDVHAGVERANMSSYVVQAVHEVYGGSALLGAFIARRVNRTWLLPCRRHTRAVGNTLGIMSCGAWIWMLHMLSQRSKTLMAVGEQIGKQRSACRALMMHAAAQK